MCLMDLGPVKERHLKSRKQEVYRRIRSQKTKVTGGTAWQSATDGKLWAWIEWFCLRLGLPAEGSTGPSKVKSVNSPTTFRMSVLASMPIFFHFGGQLT